MGRSKARRPKRAQAKPAAHELDELTQIYLQFDVDQLWATLFAAASSPSARHRATSIGVALAASLRASSVSSERSREPLPDVQELVDTAAESTLRVRVG